MHQDSERSGSVPETKRTTLRVPHIYVILFVFSALAAVATYFVPAGKYQRVPGPDGRTAIDPDSFRMVESDPVGIVGFMTAIPKGFIEAAEVVFFTFIIGGMFMVIRETGIIETAVDKLTRRFAKRRVLVIPVLMVLFAAIASLIGTQELSLVYVPVVLPLLIALGFDSITAAAVALCATTAGFAAGVLNPINTGLAQKIAGIPVFSGIPLRLAVFVALVGVAVAYVMVYARKISSNPTSGYFMATLALAGVRWDKWVRFFFPLFLMWVAIAAGFTVFAQITTWTG